MLGVAVLVWKLDVSPRPPPSGSLPPPLSPTSVSVAAVPRPGLLRRPWAWWKRVVLNTYAEIGNDRLLAVAAGVVFYALLAIFPAVTAFVSLYGMVASYSTINDHISLLSYVLPAGGLEIVQEQIGRLVAKRADKLSFGFVAGLLVALWSANAGIKAMMDALNVIENEHEQRGFIRLNAVSLTFTFGAIVFLLRDRRGRCISAGDVGVRHDQRRGFCHLAVAMAAAVRGYPSGAGGALSLRSEPEQCALAMDQPGQSVRHTGLDRGIGAAVALPVVVRRLRRNLRLARGRHRPDDVDVADHVGGADRRGVKCGNRQAQLGRVLINRPGSI